MTLRARLTPAGSLFAIDLETPWHHWFLGGFLSAAEAIAVGDRLALTLGRVAIWQGQ